MTVMTVTNNTNKPFFLGGGDRVVKSDATFLRSIGRSTVIAPFTVVAKGSDGKFVPLGDVAPVQTSAYLTCGTRTGDADAWKAVTTSNLGQFSITVDGEVINVTGLDFAGIGKLSDIANVVNSHVKVAGKFRCVDVDGKGTSFRFESLKTGLGASSISVLSVVTPGAGLADIAGKTTVGFNGLAGDGTITAATGSAYTTVPAGIYIGTTITAAAIDAGDVTKKQVCVGGYPVYVDKNQLVFENSQTLASVIKVNGIFQTVADYMRNQLGIIAVDTVALDGHENS